VQGVAGGIERERKTMNYALILALVYGFVGIGLISGYFVLRQFWLLLDEIAEQNANIRQEIAEMRMHLTNQLYRIENKVDPIEKR
jgi:hypothetical protein